jgi:RNA polymerase sigma-70 factor (ECF subfamily)
MDTRSHGQGSDLANLDDGQLVRLIANGSSLALEEIYDRYSRLIFSLALHMLGNRSTAEEVTLDVFTKLWEKAASYQPRRASVRTWLTSIARYRSIDELRRLDVRPEGHSTGWEEIPADPVSSSDPEAEAELRLARAHVWDALTSIPREQRQVIYLAYFTGQTQREIAAQLDIPLGTVKTRLRLGMEKLRTLLGDWGLSI